jgi:hypothetical protein
MPTRKSKQLAKERKRTEARKRDLEEMHAKLVIGAENKGMPKLPSASVRFRKSLKNRTKL